MNWTEILQRAGIPEPPGRAELVEQLRVKREAAVAAAAAAGGVAAPKPKRRQTARKRKR